MSTIIIKGLKLAASIGVYAWEKKIKQQVILDLEIDTDITQAALHDNLQYTLDYTEICTIIDNRLKSQHFNLLETLASDLLNQIAANFNCRHVKLLASKPHAIKQANNVSVCVEYSSVST